MEESRERLAAHRVRLEEARVRSEESRERLAALHVEALRLQGQMQQQAQANETYRVQLQLADNGRRQDQDAFNLHLTMNDRASIRRHGGVTTGELQETGLPRAIAGPQMAPLLSSPGTQMGTSVAASTNDTTTPNTGQQMGAFAPPSHNTTAAPNDNTTATWNENATATPNTGHQNVAFAPPNNNHVATPNFNLWQHRVLYRAMIPSQSPSHSQCALLVDGSSLKLDLGSLALDQYESREEAASRASTSNVGGGRQVSSPTLDIQVNSPTTVEFKVLSGNGGEGRSSPTIKVSVQVKSPDYDADASSWEEDSSEKSSKAFPKGSAEDDASSSAYPKASAQGLGKEPTNEASTDEASTKYDGTPPPGNGEYMMSPSEDAAYSSSATVYDGTGNGGYIGCGLLPVDNRIR